MQHSEDQCLPNELVQDFIADFYGYGNLDSPYWYIGMEEGGGNCFQEILLRMQTWKSMGSSSTVDVKDYHRAIGIVRYFTEKPVLQRTWSKLIRIHLRLNEEACSTQHIRTYQSQSWGCSGGDNCLLELMPLPSPAIDKWKYNQFSRLPSLKSKKVYWNHVLPDRESRLRELIEEHRPKLVLFYGLSQKYMKVWTEIVGFKMQASLIDRLYLHTNKQTIYGICPHPVAHGFGNEYYNSVGNHLHNMVLAKFQGSG